MQRRKKANTIIFIIKMTELIFIIQMFFNFCPCMHMQPLSATLRFFEFARLSFSHPSSGPLLTVA